MRKWALVLALVGLCSLGWARDNEKGSEKIETELNKSTEIVQEMTSPNTTAGIPQDVLKNAQCVAVIPHMVNAGLVVGGRHGAGVATCRVSGNRWSPPAPISITGASWGAQIGGQTIDLVMMIMNQNGMQALRSGHFKVGAEANAAAGPVGRQAAAEGGWKAGILTYSRAKGAYAGITLNGADVQKDDKATRELFGKDVGFDQILNGQVPMPNAAQAQDFIHAVEQAQQSARAR